MDEIPKRVWDDEGDDMDKRKAVWISALIAALQSAAVATVTYFAPANATAINIAISAFCDAAIIAVNAFVKEAAK